MNEVLGVLAYLLLPAIGIIIWRTGFVRTMPFEARIGIAAAAGSLLVAIAMALLSLLHVEWSRSVVLGVMILFMACGGVLVFRNRTSLSAPRIVPQYAALGGTITCVLLTLYGTITARESCGDLPFTWGPKAIRWFRAGGIDAGVLHTWPHLTVDYPPLQTLLLAFSNTVASQFPWWAAVLAAPLFLAVTLGVIRGVTRDDVGTFQIAATLAWTYALAYPAGCAEPPLLLFETITILALTFLDDPRAQTALAALGVAGAVFTKLEGTTFAIAVLITILVVQRNLRRALIVAAGAAILFGGWMTFVFANDLLYMYGGAKMPIYWSTLPIVLKTLAKVASFQLYGLPWLVPIVLIVLGNARRALVPISIALLTAGATVYFYTHYPDPVWWIESSSPRVLLTPLLALSIGAVAAWRKPAI